MIKIYTIVRIIAAFTLTLFSWSCMAQSPVTIYGRKETTKVYGAVENQAPQLVFDAPTMGFRYNAGEKMVVKVSAFDADGTISKVELLSPHIDGGIVHTISAPPFTFTYSSLPTSGDRGWNTLIARAYDNQGKVTELSMDVFENKFPEIVLNSSCTRMDDRTTVALTAIVFDPENQLIKVEFYSAENKIGEDYSAPYSCTWTASEGSHVLSAIAVDNFNGRKTSNTLYLNVDPAPAPLSRD